MGGPVPSSGRPRLALLLGLLANLALVPLLAAAAPPSHWSPIVLVLALAAIGPVSYFGSVAIRSDCFLDAQFVAALLAVVLLGPLPALGIWLAGEVMYLGVDRRRLVAHLANAASYGWAVFTGSVVFAAIAPAGVSPDAGGTFAAIGLVAVAMVAVNFAVTRLIVAVVLDGRSLVETVERELIRPAPATALMVLTGVATVFVYAHVGILALGLFAVAVLVPQTLLAALLKPHPVSDLERPAARAVYAQEIGRMMGVRGRKRLVLRDAALYMHHFPQRAPNGMLSDPSDHHRYEVIETVLYARQHWGSAGNPNPIDAGVAPLASRILAVSDLWAALTAKGSAELSHERALGRAEAHTSVRVDRRVMDAAHAVIAQARFASQGEAAYRPRIDSISLPRLASRPVAAARPS
jgi:hypothetical protein